MGSEVAIGIDLGTNYSCVAFLQAGKVEVIPNFFGNHLTPSVVAYTNRGQLVGETAVDQRDSNPENTVSDVKRLLGRRFDDPVIKPDLAYFPYKVVDDRGRITIEVECQGQTRQVTPEQVSASILHKIKETAEAHLGYKVKKAVITVPAFFDNKQRQATLDSAKIAGIEVLRLLNEPTAAAIAFDLDTKSESRGPLNVLVYDLGGGTFDVSVLTIDGAVVQVKGVAGDNHLGGEDFDNRVLDYLADEFAFKFGKDLGSNKRATRRLRTACERAKRVLSTIAETKIELDCLHEGVDFTTRLSRAKFEELCLDLFQYTLLSVDAALANAGMQKSDIDEIILVGGCTRIPKIQQIIKEHFDGKEVNTSIDAEEAVVVGAAIEAAILSGNKSVDIQNTDTLPLSLGIESSGGVMTTILPRNTPLPAHKVHHFTTNADDQTSVTIKVFEGERALTKDNILIGTFDLNGIEPAPRGKRTVEVKFDVNVDGILSVAAIEPKSRVHERVTIHHDHSGLTSDELDKMITESEQYRYEDHQEQERIKAKISLEFLLAGLRDKLQEDELAEVLSDSEHKKIILSIETLLAWVQKNQYEAKAVYNNKKLLFCQEMQPILNKIRSQVPKNFNLPPAALGEPRPEEA
jgi:heat shock protein 1/8